MNKLFLKIGSMIEKNPIKTLLAFILIFAIMIAGAVNVYMATGNDTLVDSKNEAYINNHIMEENFGGEAIMVLFQGEKDKLLDINNLEKIWNVEKELDYNEDIFSLMSPASIVNQIAGKQGDQIKENLPGISEGLVQMSEKLIEIGTELASKDMPDPDEIEKKLDDLMSSMDPDSLMEDMLKQQESEMAKMNEQVSTMGGGLGEMGNKLVGIGSELDSKDVPNPQDMEKKLDSLMNTMDPDKLMKEMLREQEAEMADMEGKVLEMSSQLKQMGDGLVAIGTNLGSMDSPNIESIGDKLKDLEDISQVFDGLISGQDNLDIGMTELGIGLSESSSGLIVLVKQLEEMKQELADPKLKEQLSEISKNIEQNSQALESMSANTNQIKQVPTSTSEGLNNIKLNLQKEIKDMKDSLPEDIPADQLEEISERLTNMGYGLNNFSNNISKLPEEIGGSLTESPSKMLSDMTTRMGSELNEMKSNLSGGISPGELKSMSSGFNTMGGNLKEMSGGLSNLPAKMGEALSGGQDPSNMFVDMTSQIETEVGQMKSNLSGGIDPEELRTMASGFVSMGENLKDLSGALENFHSKSDMMTADFPKSQVELDTILYEEDGKLRTMFSEVVLDDTHNLMMIKLEGNLADKNKDVVYRQVEDALAKEDFDDMDYIISGKPVLDSSLRDEMQTNMKYMIVSALVLMFIILMLVFKIRWRVLSLGIIFVSVLATLGLMGHLSVPMTMVSMAVFPILIGLGIDYSIQFQNRYEEEKSTKTTLMQIGKAVGIAVIATVLGFISLYASPVPMIKDFGKMLTIGVLVSFVGSIFLLMPILNSRDTLEAQTKRKFKAVDDKPTIIDKMLNKSTLFISKHKILIIVFVSLLAALGLFADSKVGVETDIETFMPQDMEALADIHYIRDIVGSTNQMAIFMEGDNLLNEESVDWMQSTISEIEERFPEKIVDIKSIDNLVSNMGDAEILSHEGYIDIVESFPESQRKMFINDDESKAVILMNVEHMATEELQGFVSDVKHTIEDSPMDVSITGKSVLDVEMIKGLTDGRIQMTLLGIGLVFLALLLIYRNIFKAFSAIFPIILIVGMSGGIMYLLGLNYTPITATLGALILGMGTEMTIILLERYLEERKLGREKLDAMLVSVNKVGKATVASGLTTVGGFSVLMLSKFVILKDFGLMTVINISLALLSTFIILPAILLIMDRFLFSKGEKIEFDIK